MKMDISSNGRGASTMPQSAVSSKPPYRVAVAAIATIAILPLFAADWNDGVNVSSSALTFKISTKDDATYGYTADDVAEFPVTWRAGETVTATDRSGNADTTTDYPSSAAASDGSVAFPSSAAGGVWTLVNSKSGTAYIVVPWSDSEVGTAVATSATLPGLAVDTKQTDDNGEGGIDRKGRAKEFPGFVAYTGDGWIGDSSAESTLKFTAPSGTVTTEAKTGTGVHTFTFTETGSWTVELIVNGTTVRKATINATAGMTIIVR